LEEVVRGAADGRDPKLFNNAAQAWNHAFFWTCMAPRKSQPAGALASAIAAGEGGLKGLKERFIDEGEAHFASGWVWLVADGQALSVISTHDGDSALLRSGTPLLTCDLWEHAYYLDYKNDRPGFLEAWWNNVANWSFAGAQFDAARSGGRGWTYAEAESAQGLAA